MTELCPICLKKPFNYYVSEPNECPLAMHVYWHHCTAGRCFCGEMIWPTLDDFTKHVTREGGVEAHLLAFTMGVEDE